ncbi:MAG: hypothetical protein OXD30_08660, partial [Bryobacterales bacterium]|nr:hypothetical protein [Bryobacterales bacterium]
AFTVLDPACGSGNFLYLALQALKGLEHRVQLEAEALGFERAFPEIGPGNVRGIEINPYAAKLARVSVWIGEIQWMRRNGFAESRDPILKPLDTIECRDAILTPDGTEPNWPEADVVIGNPPFLGGKLLITNLGENYVSRMFAIYDGRDLVCYWFEKAGRQILFGKARRAGLVATNSIRGGANRRALQAATADQRIFEAWSDEPWVVDGAAVRVSLVCFLDADDNSMSGARLDGESVDEVHTDLTAQRGGVGVDLTDVRCLAENAGAAFMGDTKGGPFDVAGHQAREWLALPANPNGRTNADILKPWANSPGGRQASGSWTSGGRFRSATQRCTKNRSGGSGSGCTRCAKGTGVKPTRLTGGGIWNRGRACGGRSTVCRATSRRRAFPSTACLRGMTDASVQTTR